MKKATKIIFLILYTGTGLVGALIAMYSKMYVAPHKLFALICLLFAFVGFRNYYPEPKQKNE